MQKEKIRNQIKEKNLIVCKTFYDDDIPVEGEIYFLNTKNIKFDGIANCQCVDVEGWRN